MILTNYEINGEWSSSEDGQQFVLDVADATGVPLDVVGQTAQGTDIYRLTMGQGDKLIVITGGVHRDEKASRELVMIKARDMAYNDDGKYTEYLNEHKVMFIPTVNPDTETRVNGQGLNINRDAYELRTPEMIALMKIISNERPDIYVDFHERAGTLERVEFIDPSKLDPNAVETIKDLSRNMEFYVREELESKGYTTIQYPQHIIGPGMTVAAAALLGSITMTPETHHQLEDGWFRVNALGEVFENILEWHSQNSKKFHDLKNRYDTEFIKPGAPFYLLNGNNAYYRGATILKITMPKGYIINDVAQFDLWRNTYNIQIDENGYVPIQQLSGKLLPHLLDPESDMKVVDAVRVEDESEGPERRTDGRYTKVLMDEWREVFIKGFYA